MSLFTFHGTGFEQVQFKDEIKGTTRINVFATDSEGNNYVNGELVNVEEVEEPKITTMNKEGHWKYTNYNCDYHTQCYLYTGSGASFNLQEVENVYKEAWIFKNSTNNSTLSDFKLYATQIANAVDDYHFSGAVYTLAIAGMVAAMPAWESINDAMSNSFFKGLRRTLPTAYQVFLFFARKRAGYLPITCSFS
ncbi:hypothetical protein ACH6EH_03330 [Paenibacillus sp. JSM ZJ436]|uniref:hypothetical protein n=1 Tax=Paenibacillus sp. JSM ZJ436 TaxID=3376190 RepID=UPI003793ED77